VAEALGITRMKEQLSPARRKPEFTDKQERLEQRRKSRKDKRKEM